MDEIKIGAEIVFNITGNHNIGYAKGEKYIGTVLSEDHRSRLYVRTIGMPRACIDERDVEWVIDPDGDFDMDEAIPNPVARELYKLMGRYVYTFGRSHESINGYIVYECMMMDRDLRYNVMYALHDHGFEIRHIDSYSWWISKKTVMSWVPKGQAVDGSGWVISFTLSFGLDNGTQIKFDEEGEYLSEIDRLNELFNVIL